MSQATDVIEFIKKHGSITTKQATDILGCYRLSGRIYDLKKFGIQIEKEMITVPRRDGTNTRVARYTIPGGVPECFRA
jgi:hypothetical protein